jgi:hypothetical protein
MAVHGRHDTDFIDGSCALMQSRRSMPRIVALLLCLSPAFGARADQAAAELLAWAIGDHAHVLVGEAHGPEEIPALVGHLAAMRVEAAPLLVALELPQTEQPALDAWLDSDGGKDARARLLGRPFWQRNRQDGRSSSAMLDLLERLRALRAGGRPLTLLAYDAGDGPAQEPAQLIAAALRERPQARLLLLAGNYRLGREDPDSLGSALAALDPLAFDVTAWTGAFWTCGDAPEAPCGLHQLETGEIRQGPVLHADARLRAQGFAGQLILRAFSASEPAVGPR